MQDFSIRDIFRGCGTAVSGVCAFSAVGNHLLPYAAGRLPENPQSVISALFPYRFPEDGRPRNLARYACVPDYHTSAGGVLEDAAAALSERFPGYSFVPFIDNSPVPEVAAAAAAGLGVIGDHGLLISPEYGSFVVIGTVVTDLVLPETGGNNNGHCGHCGACAAACPAGCIGSRSRETAISCTAAADKKIRCLSAITQRKGALTAEEIALIRKNGLVWGCDRCQEVCPHNAAAVIRPHRCFTRYQPWLDREGLDHLEGRAYGWRGRAVLERNLEIMEKTDGAV
ncbi:MAG: DUF1730 domain-containing protein [Oscillospiraceae bacterium]|nr:DUF1730 domain-containing protein [Oscillospiraceae bacterium]